MKHGECEFVFVRSLWFLPSQLTESLNWAITLVRLSVPVFASRRFCGAQVSARGITSGPLSTQDGGTSDRSLKAGTNPSSLPRRLRLIKRYTSSPACFALQILAQASCAGTKALREGYARRHVPNCFPVNNERTCR